MFYTVGTIWRMVVYTAIFGEKIVLRALIYNAPKYVIKKDVIDISWNLSSFHCILKLITLCDSFFI